MSIYDETVKKQPLQEELEGGKLLNMVINNLTKMSPFKPYNLENIIS